MDIEAGRELLHYRLIEKVGEGGMGVVWKATDTTLDREVAIKILPDVFSQDVDRLARFEREAKLLASLNHPNIASVFSVHEADTPTGSVRFLSMELVEGEDLARRLSRGPIPTDDALKVALQIAEALEAAHDNGVIHRDLKPANILVTDDGRVKVLDFGLAKAFDSESKPGDPAMSPTLTSAGTVAGMILGTAAYMSPEQARGQAVDKRADIWALGCVMFEIFGGRMAFTGDTISDTLASVLKLEPDWSSLPDDVPRRTRRLIERCLVKDNRQRLRDAGEARINIERTLRGEDLDETATSGTAMPAEMAPRRSPLLWIAAIVAIAALAGILGWLLKPSPAPDDRVRRFLLAIPDLQAGYRSAPVISPDGTRIAFVSNDQLWIRDLDQVEAREIPESEGARALFWSWDGAQIAWSSGGKIWRAPATGGARTAVCDIPSPIDGGAWGSDDRMVLAPNTGALMVVPARGGDPGILVEAVEDQESDFHKPHFLPDGRGLLYGVHRTGEPSSDTLEVFADGQRKIVLRIEGHRLEHAQYSTTGHIVYHRSRGNDGVWTVPFSLETLETTGDPVLIDPAGSRPSVARDGSLVYHQGSVGAERQLVWVDRNGLEIEAIGQVQPGMIFPSLSPDGRMVAVSADEDDSRDIWIHDVERGTRTRLTFDEAPEWSPTWSPDGRRVLYSRDFGINAKIVGKPADGAGDVLEIVDGMLGALAPDGMTLVYSAANRETGSDIHLTGAEGTGESSVFLATPSEEGMPQISPDGRYVAYGSNESGQGEVYLKKHPSGEGKWQVSVDGGTWPRWNRNGGELFYIENGSLMAVDVGFDPTVRLGAPTKLFSRLRTGYDLDGPRQYDVSPDGSRFVIVKNVIEVDNVPSLMFVENWFTTLAETD